MTSEKSRSKLIIRLRGQAVKTSPFHGGNTSSILVGVTYADVAQLAEQLICNQQVTGSIPAISFPFWDYLGPLAQLVRATGS